VGVPKSRRKLLPPGPSGGTPGRGDQAGREVRCALPFDRFSQLVGELGDDVPGGVPHDVPEIVEGLLMLRRASAHRIRWGTSP
jgi:hypothetical protein